MSEVDYLQKAKVKPKIFFLSFFDRKGCFIDLNDISGTEPVLDATFGGGSL